MLGEGFSHDPHYGKTMRGIIRYGPDPVVAILDSKRAGETYEGGRYLEIEPQPGGQFLIDFNYAYNPSCAYNPRWHCPLAPVVQDSEAVWVLPLFLLIQATSKATNAPETGASVASCMLTMTVTVQRSLGWPWF